MSSNWKIPSDADPPEELRQPGDQWVRFDGLCRNPGDVVGVVAGPGRGRRIEEVGGEVEDDVVVGGGLVAHPLRPAQEAADLDVEARLLENFPGHRRLQPFAELDPPAGDGPLPDRGPPAPLHEEDLVAPADDGADG